MRVGSITVWRRRGVIHLLAAFGLLMAVLQDTGHVHAAGPDVPPCYVCHFSPDLAAAPAVQVPGRIAAASRPATPSPFAAPCAVAAAPYDARGPPLLG